MTGKAEVKSGKSGLAKRGKSRQRWNGICHCMCGKAQTAMVFLKTSGRKSKAYFLTVEPATKEDVAEFLRDQAKKEPRPPRKA